MSSPNPNNDRDLIGVSFDVFNENIAGFSLLQKCQIYRSLMLETAAKIEEQLFQDVAGELAAIPDDEENSAKKIKLTQILRDYLHKYDPNHIAGHLQELERAIRRFENKFGATSTTSTLSSTSTSESPT
jgi:hypothetical protein